MNLLRKLYSIRLGKYFSRSCYFKSSLRNPQFSVLQFSSSNHLFSTCTPKMSDYILQSDTPIMAVDCTEAFGFLTDQEKLYLHHLSQACNIGSLIVLLQTSPESPLIFILLFKLFHAQSPEELKPLATQCGLTEDESLAFLLYSAAFFVFRGNYKNFGDTKIVPDLPQDKFEKLIRASKFAAQEPQYVESLLSRCLGKIYSLNKEERIIGFPGEGVTTYLSKNITHDDVTLTNDFLKRVNLEAYNTRLVKTTDETGKISYEIRLCSVLNTDEDDETMRKMKDLEETHPTHKFVFTRGDFGPLLDLVNKNLQITKEYAANENQRQMLENYIKSFHTGSLDAHIEGSRYWIKDQGPVVESYIGFIENYRDPAGMRAEFEGFTTIVNKAQSVKYTNLVKAAKSLLCHMPWPETYEKTVFLQPDYNSLDVQTFAGSSIPVGICIPNYLSVRQNDGFKNMTLGNCLRCLPTKPPNFLCKEDQDLYLKHFVQSLEVIVANHELLGHGSGKLFYKNADGTFNFDTNKVLDLETNLPLTKWYNEGDTFDALWGSVSNAYEECRAECAGIYLATIPEDLKVLGVSDENADDVLYTCWLSLAYTAVSRMDMYSVEKKQWMQAHAQADFAILRVLLEHGEGFLKLEMTTGEDGKPDLLITMDRSKLLTLGKKALGDFFRRLQFYKSTANAESAKAMFNKYTEMKEPFLQYRDIVVARRRPRRIENVSNTFLQNGEVVLKNYESTREGLIQSHLERYPNDEKLYAILEDLWAKDQPHFA